MYGKIAIIVAAGALTAACANQGYGSDPRQQRALGGAAIGAAAGAAGGAIVAGKGDDLEGALIGGALGAAAGAVIGAETAPAPNRSGPQGQDMYYDQNAQRYFYVDRASGRTYWENGQVRSY